ncbi:MAG: hypothetical protein QG572_1762 [Pseudomonadota bacterium]|nr:hypothetical protein [Pseudomonadota bacterium]
MQQLLRHHPFRLRLLIRGQQEVAVTRDGWAAIAPGHRTYPREILAQGPGHDEFVTSNPACEGSEVAAVGFLFHHVRLLDDFAQDARRSPEHDAGAEDDGADGLGR